MDKRETGTAGEPKSKTRYTREQRAQARRSFQEIGQSIARAVLEGRQSEDWAWQLIGDLGIYERWELDLWIEMHRQSCRSVLQAQKRRQQHKDQLQQQIDAAKPRKLLKALRKSTNG